MNISLDFYLLIAYFIPGLLAIKGLAYFSPSLEAILRGRNSIQDISFLVVLAISVGMMISIMRAGTLDYTFQIPLSNTHQWASVERCDPIYYELEKDKLKAFSAAKTDDKRPYQFYGNTIIALLFIIAGYYFKGAGASQTFRLLKFLALIFLIVAILYPGARTSHWRYMTAIEGLTGCLQKVAEK